MSTRKKVFDEVTRILRMADATASQQTQSNNQPNLETLECRVPRLTPAARQINFGVAMVLIAIFTMCFALVVPSGERWFAVMCAVVTLFIGIWSMDRGGRRLVTLR